MNACQLFKVIEHKENDNSRTAACDLSWFIINIFFPLQPWFLTHSSQNPGNFLSSRSNESIFCIAMSCSLNWVSSSWKHFNDVRWNECLIIHHKPISVTAEFLLMRWLLEIPSSWRDGCQGDSNMWSEDWNFQFHSWHPMESESITNDQWQSIMSVEWSLHKKT